MFKTSTSTSASTKKFIRVDVDNDNQANIGGGRDDKKIENLSKTKIIRKTIKSKKLDFRNTRAIDMNYLICEVKTVIFSLHKVLIKLQIFYHFDPENYI